MSIFELVKKLKLQAVFLIFVLMMPLMVISFTNLGDTIYMYEQIEKSEEEQREEQKCGKEEVDNVEKFTHSHKYSLATLTSSNSNFIIKSNDFASISKEVLTPPPKFI